MIIRYLDPWGEGVGFGHAKCVSARISLPI